MNNKVGVPYFPATMDKYGRAVSICPACAARVRNPGKHWAQANHVDSDVTPETSRRAFDAANFDMETA